MADHLSVLDTAGKIEERRRPTRSESPWRERSIFQSQYYGPHRTLREWTLTWSPATKAQAEMVAHHFQQNKHGTFSIHVPGGNDVPVLYVSPPRRRVRTAGNFDIQLTVREAFARSH